MKSEAVADERRLSETRPHRADLLPHIMLKTGTRPALRAIGFLWGKMGAARLYVLAAGSLIIILAGVGVFHLASVRKQSQPAARSEVASDTAPSPSATAVPLEQTSSQTIPPPAAGDPIADHPVIAITEVTPKRRRSRNGQTRIDVKIGVTPQANVKKGQVEIRVFFYDVTRNREIRPTDAQVAYEWLTPVRDWSDPTPKYLAATYLRGPTPRHAPERLRYGGFIVRVYFDGRLQDERAEPKGLLAALQSGARPRSAPSPTPGESLANAAAAAPRPTVVETPTVQAEVASNANPTPATSTAPPDKRSSEEVAALPFARPVPGKPGFVYSLFDEKFLIDVRGAPPGTVANDPHSGKAFRVP